MKRFLRKIPNPRTYATEAFFWSLKKYRTRTSRDVSGGMDQSVPQETPLTMTYPVVAHNGALEVLVINPDWPRHQLTKFRPPDLADVPADAIWIKEDRPFVVLQHSTDANLPAASGEVLWSFRKTDWKSGLKRVFGLAGSEKEWVTLLEGYRYDLASRILAPHPAPVAVLPVKTVTAPVSPELAATNGHSADGINGHSPNGHLPTALATATAPASNAQIVKEAMEGAFSSTNKPVRPADFGAHLDMPLIKQRRTTSRQKELQKVLDKAKPYNWIAIAVILGIVAVLYLLGQGS
jgi:hypothetical protein